MKVHKDHFDKNEEFIGYCKGMYSLAKWFSPPSNYSSLFPLI